PSQHVDQALPDSPISYRSSLAARRSGSARLPDLLPLVPRSTSIRLCPTPRSPTARPSQHVDQALPDYQITSRPSLAARRSGSARLPDLLPLVPRSTSIRLCPTPRSPTARPSQHVDQALPDSPISYRSSLAARRSGSARLPDLLPLVPRSTSIRLWPRRP